MDFYKLRIFKKMQNQKAKSKLVIRRLPPTLPSEIFFSTLQPWESYIAWSHFIPGKLAKT
jgi:hypothetical protein